MIDFFCLTRIQKSLNHCDDLHYQWHVERHIKLNLFSLELSVSLLPHCPSLGWAQLFLLLSNQLSQPWSLCQFQIETGCPPKLYLQIFQIDFLLELASRLKVNLQNFSTEGKTYKITCTTTLFLCICSVYIFGSLR